MSKNGFSKKLAHRSMDWRRTKSNPREHAFAVEWERENRPVVGRGLGSFGTLQALMFDQWNPRSTFWPCNWSNYPVRAIIRNRDAAIVATVVQWLGSPVGFDFLIRVLRSCGWRIERDPEWEKGYDYCGVCRGKGRLTIRDKRQYCGWCGYPWKSWNHIEARNLPAVTQHK